LSAGIMCVIILKIGLCANSDSVIIVFGIPDLFAEFARGVTAGFTMKVQH
jgi:hypothetical protein